MIQIDGIVIARTLNNLKKVCNEKQLKIKGINWRTVKNVLESLNVVVDVAVEQRMFEMGKSAAGNPFKRTFENGFSYKFTLGGQRFCGDTFGSAYALAIFISGIKVLDCAKEIKEANLLKI